MRQWEDIQPKAADYPSDWRWSDSEGSIRGGAVVAQGDHDPLAPAAPPRSSLALHPQAASLLSQNSANALSSTKEKSKPELQDIIRALVTMQVCPRDDLPPEGLQALEQLLAQEHERAIAEGTADDPLNRISAATQILSEAVKPKAPLVLLAHGGDAHANYPQEEEEEEKASSEQDFEDHQVIDHPHSAAAGSRPDDGLFAPDDTEMQEGH